MDNSNKIVPPHLNAEIYRSDTSGTTSQSYLDYIQIHKDGRVLIGCSELTSRYWNGGAIIGKNVAEVSADKELNKKDINLHSSTADGIFIDSSKVLLCEDDGAVSIWRNNDGAWNNWTEDTSFAQHNNVVMAVDCLTPGEEYVTAGADSQIKVWNIREMYCIRDYYSAHSQAVYGVATRPTTTNCFASGSLDGFISLWGDNTEKPMLNMFENDCGIRCLKWLDENRLVFGDEAGALKMVDIRNTEDITHLADFPAPVHKVMVQTGSSKVAVCCDNRIVTVYDTSDNRVIFEDRTAHRDFVRGLAWDSEDENLLHTVAWDGKIVTHNIG